MSLRWTTNNRLDLPNQAAWPNRVAARLLLPLLSSGEKPLLVIPFNRNFHKSLSVWEWEWTIRRIRRKRRRRRRGWYCDRHTIERDSVISTCALYVHFVRVVDSVQGFLFHDEAVQVVDRLSQQNITAVVARPVLVHPPLKLLIDWSRRCDINSHQIPIGNVILCSNELLYRLTACLLGLAASYINTY